MTVLPLAKARTSGRVAAMPSTAWSDTAWVALALTAWRTVERAQSTLRPRVSAIDWILAAASLVTFWPSVPVMSPPLLSTGDAAPMLVPGAITAMLLASVMNVPALAAKPPAGATHTMTGIVASSSEPTMSFVEKRSPPGVSSSMITAASPSASAREMPSAM